MGEAIEQDDVRIGTKEREEAARLLGEHFAEGRLAVEEYDDRVSAALGAQTRGALRPLFRDLPAPYPAFMVPPVQAITSAVDSRRTATLPVYQEQAPPPAVHSDKYRVVAGALQILLPFGIGRFYTGHTGIAVAQLLTALVGIGVIWSLIDGVLMLVNGGEDANGRPLRM